MTDYYANLAALPSFLAESNLWDGAFSPKSKLLVGSPLERARRYLGGHRYGVRHGRTSHSRPSAEICLVLEIALSLLERGEWTLPTWRLERSLAEHARETADWKIDRASTSMGDLRLMLRSSVAADDLKSLLIPCPLETEESKQSVLLELRALLDPNSAGELVFLEDVASHALPLPWLCMLSPQRSLASMGLNDGSFQDQRVDFALETPHGDRLVIEIDGSQHLADAGQALLDSSRDSALSNQGWEVWRIDTTQLNNPETLKQELQERLTKFKSPKPDAKRDLGLARIFWSATAAARIQALVLEAILDGAVGTTNPLNVAVQEYSTEIAEEALRDLDEWVNRLASLYSVEGIPRIQLVAASDADLLVDIDVLHPLRDVATSSQPVAWSRSACRIVDPIARRIGIGSTTPRVLPAAPNEALLDHFVRDLFRKDGFRRDENGASDQAAITCRILQGKDAVGLLPTGAGKSLPYMLAGLLLPGLTLYVGPLVSLLQDQAERLMELGIGHVEYISSALDRGQKIAALQNVRSQGMRFLLVSPERFLTRDFIDALNDRTLWQGTISQVVIDECHCVSEWGHEFRPAYLSLGRIAKERSKRFDTSAPLVGLTGTASTIVLSDVLRELGISDPEACIRANNLDRREITMKCTRVPYPAKREKQIEDSVRAFASENNQPTDGVLVFCPFRRGRSMGVFSVAAHLSRNLPGTDVRFYTGGDAPWKDFAVYRLQKKRTQLTELDIQKATPDWAQTNQQTKSWDQIKSEVQRNYVSGAKHGFRILVATKSFGMGIDKPSIRKVIHAVAPTSPEAYYQEIGRAGRDGKVSEAELLFCDIEPGVTDRLFDPAISQPQAQSIYKEFFDESPYGGGDFVRTYYFQNKTFSGRKAGIDAIFMTALALHRSLKAAQEPVVSFDLLQSKGTRAGDDSVTELEHAIVRLIHLGAVEGYIKDYNKRCFSVDVRSEWILVRDDPSKLSAYFATQFEQFIRRYHLTADMAAVGRIAAQNTKLTPLYDSAAGELMDFVYEHIERQRRQSTRQMLELARVGASSPETMRERLLNYLQVSLRYTSLLEELERNASPNMWTEILFLATSPQDLSELHGATQRVLESYPTHPGLLFIAAVSRSFNQAEDQGRSSEEIQASLSYSRAEGIDLKEFIEAFDSIETHGYLGNRGLRPLIRGVLGLLHLEKGPLTGKVLTYLEHVDVRRAWLAKIVKNAADEKCVHDRGQIA